MPELIHRGDLHDAAAGGVIRIVHTAKGIPLGYVRQISHEIRETEPVQTVLAVGEVPYGHFHHLQLVRLGHLVVVLQGRIALKLLYHEDIAFPERVVQPASVGIQVDPAGLRVVMIHLHHSGEDAVIILAKQLRDHERIYFKLVAYRDRIDLQLVFSLLHTGGVRHLVRRYHESRPVRETGGECRRG